MKWKKILLALLLFLLLSGIILAYLSNQLGLSIYGAKTAVVSQEQLSFNDQDVYIKNVNILAADGSSFIPNQHIWLKDGIIAAIDSQVQEKKDCLVIDGKGKFLIPGLIDSHVHLFKSANDLLLYVANGVTGIREMIGEAGHLEWREEIQNGKIGPDMFIASPRIGSFDRLEGWWMQYSQGYNNISNAREAERFVQKYAEKGYDAIKIYSQVNRESYEALNNLAVSHGMKVVGHFPWELSFSDVYASNQTEIAHLEEIMNALRREFGKIDNEKDADAFLEFVDKKSREIAPKLIENDISVTTTLWLTQSFVRQKFELNQVLKEVELAYENPGISEWSPYIPGGLGWLPEVNRYKLTPGLSPEDYEFLKIFWQAYGQACALILKNISEAGVNIMAGTDANLPPAVPGFSLHDELIAMKEAGMSEADILRSATRIPAAWMGKKSGRISEGYEAKLVLLDANPLEDISHTQKISHVFLDGKSFDREALDAMLDAVKMANDRSRRMSIEAFLGN